MTTVFDTASVISPAALKAAGALAVTRYLARQDTAWKRSKTIHAPEYAALKAAKLPCILNFEDVAGDWRGGAAGGKEDATLAVSMAKALGYPVGQVLVGSCDFDAEAKDKAVIVAYAKAFAAVIHAAGYVPGVYSSYDVLSWVHDLGTFGFFWQAGLSTGWSGGRNAHVHPAAHLFQRKGGTVGGSSVDYNDVLKPIPGITATHATTSAPAAFPVLKLGSTGSNVLALQDFLNRVFRSYSSLKEDGEYGPATVAVVKEYQRRSGLTADGTVGPKTLAKLRANGFRK